MVPSSLKEKRKSKRIAGSSDMESAPESISERILVEFERFIEGRQKLRSEEDQLNNRLSLVWEASWRED